MMGYQDRKSDTKIFRTYYCIHISFFTYFMYIIIYILSYRCVIMSENEQGNTNSVPFTEITLDSARKALYLKIKDYPGGIEGVWRSLAAQFKKEEELDPSGIKGIERTKIRRDAFRKQISRLKNRVSNEKMTFTVKNSSLLLLNIFEILGISTIKDLLGESFQKDDIEIINRETNINSKEILDKLNTMNDILLIYKNRTTRFPVAKVCHDFEDIINRLYKVIHYKPDNIEENIEFTYIINYIINNHKQSSLALMSNSILQDYREYFSQDILLNEYLEIILSTNFSDYNKGKVFLLSPLYILYFLTTANKKFLSVIITSEKINKKGIVTKPFKEDNIINNLNMKELINNNKHKSTSEYILSIINNIYSCLKNIILEMKKRGVKTVEEKHHEYFSILEETIKLFFNLYTEKTTESSDWIEHVCKKAKNLNDFNYMMSMGRAILLIPSESDINELDRIRNRLEKIEKELKRDY